jgi:hypothetical protein
MNLPYLVSYEVLFSVRIFTAVFVAQIFFWHNELAVNLFVIFYVNNILDIFTTNLTISFHKLIKQDAI